MISANQLYKQSKSNLTFKEWLKNNQRDGMLENHEKMYNMIDEAERDTNKLTTQQGTKKLGGVFYKNEDGAMVEVSNHD